MRSFSACCWPCWILCGRAASGGVWRAVTYFSLWAVRLSGWLPELHVCLAAAACWTIRSARFFSRGQAGLICGHCRRTLGAGNSWELSAESRATAAEMLRQPVAELSKTEWEQSTAADLRRFLVQQMEAHAERRLITAPMLES